MWVRVSLIIDRYSVRNLFAIVDACFIWLHTHTQILKALLVTGLQVIYRL